MMKKMLKGMALASIAAAVLAALLLTGCDSGGGDGGDYPNLKGKITIHFKDAKVTKADTSMELTAKYSGTEAVSYQWNHNKKAINGAVGKTFKPTTAGSYTVTVKADKYSPKTSSAVTVTAPLDGILVIKNETGEDVTGKEAVIDTELTAEYTGTSLKTVTYEWYKDGELVHTGATYTPASLGFYTVTASDGSGSKTATLEITIDPLTGTLAINNADGIDLSATGAEVNTMLYALYTGSETVEITYKWFKGTDTTTTPVATTAQYTPTETGTYTVTANAEGFHPKKVTIEITQANLTGHLTIRAGGNNVTEVSVNTPLTAHYDGSEIVTFEWFKVEDNNSTSVATGENYTPTTTGTYTVTASAEGYSSKSASVTVNDASNLGGHMLITGLETDDTGIVNKELTASYEGGTEIGVTVRWYQEGNATPLVVSDSTVAKYIPTQVGTYYAVASLAGYNSLTSDYITVTLPNLAGNISVSPVSATTFQQLTATYTGSEPDVTIHWRRIGDASDLATGNTYTPQDVGTYTAVATLTGYNSKTSNSVTVELSTLSGTVTITPATPKPGDTLNVSYSGSDNGIDGSNPVVFEWYHNGVALANEHGSTYVANEEGSYKVAATARGYHSKDSNTVTVELAVMTGTVSIGGTLTVGNTLTASGISVPASGLTYQWKYGETVVGGDSSTYAVPLESSAAGSYTVTVSAFGYHSQTSAAVTVSLATFSGNVTATPTPSGHTNAYTLTGDTLTAAYSGSETGTKTWQWKKDGANVGTNSATFSPTDAGSYTVTLSVNGYNPITSSPAITVYQRVTVTFNPNGGNWSDNSTANRTVVIGATYTVTDPGTVTRNYFDFSGEWYQNADGTGTAWIFATSTVSGNTTLYAKWNARPLLLSEVAGYLAAQTGGASAADPIPLKVNDALGTTTSASTGWGQIRTAISSADKYVNLDLSGSTMTGGTFGYNVGPGGPGKIVNFTFPSSATITSIGNYAFYGCSLTTITIPEGVTSIGDAAFQNCSSLTTITLPASLVTISNGIFSGCSSLTAVIIPSGVTSIGDSAFSGCSSLTAVIIPSGVTSIGAAAFRDCTSLTEVIVNATTPPTLGGTTVFYLVTAQIRVPAGSVTAYQGATNWSTYASRIVSQ